MFNSVKLTLLFFSVIPSFAAIGPLSNCNIGFSGDSLTAGSFSTGGNDYPSVAMSLGKIAAPGNNTKVVSAFPGRDISNAAFNYTAEMHPSSPAVTGKCGYIFVMIGINNVVNGDGAGTIESQLSAFWSTIKADGWTLLPMTMTPTGQPAAQEAVRVAVNAWIKTQTSSWDRLIDTAALFDDPFNGYLYYTDQIHFRDPGYAVIAHGVYRALVPEDAATNIRQTGATPREAVLKFTAPYGTACTFEVSESPTYSPLINDVNTSMFSGSNSDFRNGPQGRERTFVIGAAGTGINYAPLAADGFKRSRAAQANTRHYVRGTCGAEVFATTVRTANIAPGSTLPMATVPVDPARLGEVGWPFLPWDSSGGAVIDPVTGVYIQAIRKMNERAQSTGDPGAQPFQHIYDDSSTWSNKGNIGSTADGSSATTTANNPLRLYSDISYNTATANIVGVQLVLTAMKDASGTTAETCLSINGATCFGPYIPITLNTGSLASTTTGDANGATASMMSAWLSTGQRVPDIYEVKGSNGVADNVGSTITLRVGSNGAFNTTWTTATHFIYDGTDYTVSSVNSGTEIVISGSPANASSKAWSAANFGFLIRKSSGGGTISIDSAVVQYLFYATHQTNGGSGSSLPCTAQRYHDGWRIGGPTGVYTNAATNASPIVIQTTTNHDFVTSDIVKVYNVPGNVAANGTWTITYVDANHFSLNGSNGTASGAFPSDVSNIVGDNGGGLVYRSGGPRGAASTGALCFMLDGEGLVDMYWLNADVIPVDMRYQGPLYTYPHHGLPSPPTQNMLIDTGDQDTPSANKIINVSGADEFWTAKYIGNQAHGMFHDIGTQVFVGPNSDIWGWNSLTPAPDTFQSKVTAFNANSTEQSFGLVGGTDVPGKYIISGKPPGGSQNGLLWMGVYDANTNAVVALTNSVSSANNRWCGTHTLFAFSGPDKINWVPYNLGGLDTQGDGSLVQANWGGPYRMLPSATLSSSTGSCVSQLSALSLSNPLNVTTSNCSTVTVGSVLPITPSNFTPANDTRFNNGIKVGDLMGSTTANGNTGGLGVDDGERQRIIGISGNQIVMTRDNAVSHASGWYLFMLCIPVPRWWDWKSAPTGETGTDPYSQNLNGIVSDPPFAEASHFFVHGSLALDDSGGGSSLTATFPQFKCPDVVGGSAPYAFRTWPWGGVPDNLGAPLSAYGCTKGNPPFGAFAGKGNGNFLEKHPSPMDNQVITPAFLDARPFGGANTESLESVTKVGTYVYKVTGYNIEAPFDEKYSRLFTGIGHRTALDVSAAGFTLPDTTPYNYTYCYTHTAGECWSGSSVGEVYVNAPFVSKVPAGYSVGPTDYSGQLKCLSKGESFSILDLNDICVTVQPAYGDTVVQYSSSHDPFNTGARMITAGLNYPRTSNNLWNTPPTTDGNWVVSWGGIINGARYLSTLVKLPPYPGPQRSVNRGEFIPIPVKVSNVPVGTSTITVEYGYNPSFWCNTRNEACVSVGSSIGATPYYYASDTYTRLSCSSGCTPVIPALSQRVMWSRVKFWNSGGSVIRTSPTEISVTP